MQEHPATLSVSAFIGKGPPRFYLPVSGEDPYTSYAQIIVNTKSLAGVDQLVADTDDWVRENVPEAMVRVRKYAVGAFDDWKIEARFSGPANADPATPAPPGGRRREYPARQPLRQGSPHQLARARSGPGSPLQPGAGPLGPRVARRSGPHDAARFRRSRRRPVSAGG